MTTIHKGDRVLDANPITQYGEGTVTTVDGDGVFIRFDSYRSYQSPGGAHYRGPGQFIPITPTVEPLADWEWALSRGKPNEPIFRALFESYLAKSDNYLAVFDMVQATA